MIAANSQMWPERDSLKFREGATRLHVVEENDWRDETEETPKETSTTPRRCLTVPPLLLLLSSRAFFTTRRAGFPRLGTESWRTLDNALYRLAGPSRTGRSVPRKKTQLQTSAASMIAIVNFMAAVWPRNGDGKRVAILSVFSACCRRSIEAVFLRRGRDSKSFFAQREIRIVRYRVSKLRLEITRIQWAVSVTITSRKRVNHLLSSSFACRIHDCVVRSTCA